MRVLLLLFVFVCCRCCCSCSHPLFFIALSQMAPPSQYSSVLLRLINYLDNTELPKGTEISRERISQLTPKDLMRWFNMQVFTTETPEDDAKPVARSTSVEFWKKALSYFMTNRLMAWNEISNVGNPTRSAKLNDLIKYIKSTYERS